MDSGQNCRGTIPPCSVQRRQRALYALRLLRTPDVFPAFPKSSFFVSGLSSWNPYNGCRKHSMYSVLCTLDSNIVVSSGSLYNADPEISGPNVSPPIPHILRSTEYTYIQSSLAITNDCRQPNLFAIDNTRYIERVSFIYI